MRKTLKELELSIPTLDVLTCKQLMGGDGYYGDDHIDGIPDVIVIGESPDSLPDTERDETENPNDHKIRIGKMIWIMMEVITIMTLIMVWKKIMKKVVLIKKKCRKMPNANWEVAVSLLQ